MIINFKKLDDNAKIPTRGSLESAGLDMYIIENVDIQPWKSAIIRTGLSMALPKGYYAKIEPRSKLSAKYGAQISAGVVDSDYRGEIMIAIRNSSNKVLELQSGDKAAQMIIKRHYSDAEIVEVDELDTTSRGCEGINSSQKRLRDE